MKGVLFEMNKNLNANQFIRNQNVRHLYYAKLMQHRVEFYFVELQFFIILVIMRKNNSRRHIIKIRVMLHEQDIK